MLNPMHKFLTIIVLGIALTVSPDLSAQKKIVFLNGPLSHGYMQHEHRAGSLILARSLVESGLPVSVQEIGPGWPEDLTPIKEADVLIVYCTGGGRHLLNSHVEMIDGLMKNGTGLVCIHYAVEAPKGDPGQNLLNWMGGYFETFWSVNPHWVADFKSFPDHPVANGLKPFSIRDEWYYHMRFVDDMKGVTPILSALPPEETLSRPNGPHSGNPHVRKAVLEDKLPQHVGWAFQRPGNGRGFGFTGGHNHWNWAHPEFRQTLLNAIVWCAGLEVPEDGVPSNPVTFEEILRNQDEPTPEKWQRNPWNMEKVREVVEEWNELDENQ